MQTAALLPIAGIAGNRQIGARTYYISACQFADGGFGVQAITPAGTPLFKTRLPGRGHDVVSALDNNHIVVVARRPQFFFSVIDAVDGSVIATLQADHGRHYYGHACFSSDNHYLFISENDFVAGRGVIGVYDVRDNYKRVDEWSAHGIGPHQLIALSDGQRIAIAVGGIQTHPETGRSILNLGSMSSALIYIDVETGELTGRYELPKSQRLLSIRHLAEGANGELCIATQYQGARFDSVPVVGFQRGGAPIEMLFAAQKVQRKMRNYCGGVAADFSGRYFAVTSPRGNVITFWRAGQRDCIDYLELPECSGVSGTDRANEFVITGGLGHIITVQVMPGGKARILRTALAASTKWDNHLYRLTT